MAANLLKRIAQPKSPIQVTLLKRIFDKKKQYKMTPSMFRLIEELERKTLFDAERMLLE